MKVGAEIKKGICFFCHDSCGVLVEVEGGHIVRVHPDPAFSFPGCEKPKMAEEFHFHPERLNYPLKRKGERGEGKWQKIPWEQALDEIAGRLSTIKEKYGAEALCLIEGDTHTDRWAGMRFLNLFGSPNHVSGGDVDLFNRLTAHYITYGAPSFIEPVSGVTGCIVNWGGNPRITRPGLWSAIRKATKAGAALITIDPRSTEPCSSLRLWKQSGEQLHGYLPCSLACFLSIPSSPPTFPAFSMDPVIVMPG